MKKFKIAIITVIFFFGILSLAGCYTKKRGVVPCPAWGQTEQSNIITGKV
ncbi:MAG: hypothetical protein L3J56_11600 [Bacteroidales bacterium]|nr:hypothetical protein [Bacteroidales bacterium]